MKKYKLGEETSQTEVQPTTFSHRVVMHKDHCLKMFGKFCVMDLAHEE